MNIMGEHHSPLLWAETTPPKTTISMLGIDPGPDGEAMNCYKTRYGLPHYEYMIRRTCLLFSYMPTP